MIFMHKKLNSPRKNYNSPITFTRINQQQKFNEIQNTLFIFKNFFWKLKQGLPLKGMQKELG